MSEFDRVPSPVDGEHQTLAAGLLEKGRMIGEIVLGFGETPFVFAEDIRHTSRRPLPSTEAYISHLAGQRESNDMLLVNPYVYRHETTGNVEGVYIWLPKGHRSRSASMVELDYPMPDKIERGIAANANKKPFEAAPVLTIGEINSDGVLTLRTEDRETRTRPYQTPPYHVTMADVFTPDGINRTLTYYDSQITWNRKTAVPDHDSVQRVLTHLPYASISRQALEAVDLALTDALVAFNDLSEGRAEWRQALSLKEEGPRKRTL
jgi:hypothetical protein